MELSQ